MKLSTIHISITLLPFILSSCLFGNPSADKGIVEGTIVYKINYPYQLNMGGMSFLYPSEMKLHFSHGKQRATFKGSMNLYGLEFIHNNESDSFYTLLKILEKRMYVPSQPGSNLFMFSDERIGKVTVDKSNTKTIAGFNCYMAQITPSDKPSSSISIWYTTEIGIEKPNRNTPFEVIPGIMLEFEMEYEDVIFHLLAEKVIEESHPDDFFEIPPGYERSSIQEIENLVRTIMQ